MVYFSGSAAVTVGEMRLGENSGPLVEKDMLALPVVAAGDCHMAKQWEVGGLDDYTEGFIAGRTEPNVLWRVVNSWIYVF